MSCIQRIGDRSLLELLHRTYTDVFDKFREDSRLNYYAARYSNAKKTDSVTIAHKICESERFANFLK